MSRNRNSLWVFSLLALVFFGIVAARMRHPDRLPSKSADLRAAISNPPAKPAFPKLSGFQPRSSARSATNANPAGSSVALGPDPRHPHRLSNTTMSRYALLRTPTAVLLRNAEMDSISRTPLTIPDHL